LPKILIVAENRGGMVGIPAAYSASQEITPNLWNPKFHHRLQRACHFFPFQARSVLSKTNPPPPTSPDL